MEIDSFKTLIFSITLKHFRKIKYFRKGTFLSSMQIQIGENPSIDVNANSILLFPPLTKIQKSVPEDYEILMNCLC